jgi:hypothetical protein
MKPRVHRGAIPLGSHVLDWAKLQERPDGLMLAII